MDQPSALLLLLLVFCLFFRRLAFVVALSMLLAFLVSKMTTANTAYFSYALLVTSIAGGVAWEVKARRQLRASTLSGGHR